MLSQINMIEEKNKTKTKNYQRTPESEEYKLEQRLVEIKRVTRVTSGGKQLSFRACMVVGDRKGKVGMGVAKGADVAIAIQKAINQAKKQMIQVPTINGTIAHEIEKKFKAARVLLKPARRGRGIIAGGSVRVVLELAGVDNVTSKILGSNNKINNIKAVMLALQDFKKVKKDITPKNET